MLVQPENNPVLLVLAGGFGTRLRTAVPSLPKALAPIDGVPFLELQIQSWIEQGISSFVFLLHHQAELIVGFLENNRTRLFNDSSFRYVVEQTPLDTGGSVANAVAHCQLKGDFLVANADTWLSNGIAQMLNVQSPAVALVERKDCGRFGRVEFEADDYVSRFSEKAGSCETGWINAGLSRLSSDLFDDWDGTPFSLERGLFQMLVSNHTLKGVKLDSDFIDIGIPDDYYKFINWNSQGQRSIL